MQPITFSWIEKSWDRIILKHYNKEVYTFDLVQMGIIKVKNRTRNKNQNPLTNYFKEDTSCYDYQF